MRKAAAKFLVKAGNALLAAATSPDAVKAEKSLAVLIVARALLAVGASASLVALVERLLG